MISHPFLSRLLPNIAVRNSLPELTAKLLFLALLSQILLVASPTPVAAQSKGRREISIKKSKKKKKGQPSEAQLGPAVLPSVSKSLTASRQTIPQRAESSGIQSSVVKPVSITTVSLRSLAQTSKGKPSLAVLPTNSTQLMPAPGTIRELEPEVSDSLRVNQTPSDTPKPFAASPAAVQNFQGEFDEAFGGGPSGTFTIPPDTMGAVGLDKVVSYLNNNIVVQDKLTGARLSVASISSFWSTTGATGVFDPRIQYDPYNNRWIVAAVSNVLTANSSVLVGISNTPDPQGTFTLFRFIVGCAPAGSCNPDGEWADFPMLGFNKNWVAVAWNGFTINTSLFTDGRVLVLDYPAMRSGTSAATLFRGASAAIGGFCMHPATTFSPTEETLYLPTHISSASATYRLHKITGTPAAPVFNVDAADRTRTGGGWTQPGGDNLPQQCVPGVGGPTQTCPAVLRGADVGDAFIRSNVVFRNGKIYYPQTIALPAGGLTVNSRFVAQWTELNTDGTFFDGGRVEDATATLSNGGKHYAYSSLAVNKNNDVLLGFSEFESDDYIDAGYAFRLAGDPAGTMRDPIIYKEGEDYYSKTFSGSRNRWGDYSHTVVDPVNDRDMWTIQEYSMLRMGTTGQAANDSRWGTWWAKVAAPAGPGDLLISEFRVRGSSGANDEFVEIYNNSGSTHTVNSSDGSAGYSVAASDGIVRFIIPNGTVIPAKGHYLGVNSIGYSLALSPAGSGTTATGDATFNTDIPDNAGIALFSTSTTANFVPATRIDAVGATAEANPLFKEGTGYPALTAFSIDYSFHRSYCPGNTAVFGTALGCSPGSGGQPKDSDNNADDFVFVDTNGTSAGAGQRLGAPGPENLSSPIERNTINVIALDTTVGASSPPNRVRDLTPDPANSSTFGTLDIRRRIQNNTGAPVNRLRFRVVDITTFPAPSGFADLRTRTSNTILVAGVGDAITCSGSPAPCTVTVQGTTLEQPPSQLNGGAFNSTYSAGTITLAAPLANGASINVRFLLGVAQTGSFRFFINVEALP